VGSLFRILNTALLVAHFTVGCCAHHAHACEAKGRLSPAQDATSPDGQRPDAADHSHQGPGDCLGSACWVVSPERAVLDGFVPPCRPLVVLPPSKPLSPADLASERRFAPVGRLLLPVRLHLADQVLLI
jgi:hypothetical protein